MGIFNDIKLSWAGRDYTIPAKGVMGAIACIENVVTLVELQRCHETKSPPLSKLCMAYGTVLRYAGAQVNDEEVYAGLFGTAADQTTIMESLTVILAMMIPPEAIRSKEEDQPLGKSQPGGKRSSKKRSKRRSNASG